MVLERITEAFPSACCVWRSPWSSCDRSGTTHPLERVCAHLNRCGRAPLPILSHKTALLRARVAREPRTACVCGPGGPEVARPALAGVPHAQSAQWKMRGGGAH